jgi:hypothetical protein
MRAALPGSRGTRPDRHGQVVAVIVLGHDRSFVPAGRAAVGGNSPHHRLRTAGDRDTDHGTEIADLAPRPNDPAFLVALRLGPWPEPLPHLGPKGFDRHAGDDYPPYRPPRGAHVRPSKRLSGQGCNACGWDPRGPDLGVGWQNPCRHVEGQGGQMGPARRDPF